MESPPVFADVLLPLPVGGRFTYRVPPDLAGMAMEGVRAVVQFGSRKIYTALILRIHGEEPRERQAKPLLSILDVEPIVTRRQLDFWDWISTYYLCHPGEVMNAALPAAFKLASETRIALNPNLPDELPTLNEKEMILLEALGHRKVIAVADVSKILEVQKTIPIIKGMIEKGLVIPEEELNDPYKPKKDSWVRLNAAFESDEAMQELFSRLEKRAVRQLEIMMTWVRLSNFGFGARADVKKTDLLKAACATSVQLENLVEKGVLEIHEKSAGGTGTGKAVTPPGDIVLTPGQQQAFDGIREQFAAKEVVLLHGVTSSGKTELYIRLISEVIERGQQVLFMLPEIALTTQIITRLRKYFGNKVGVYHSRFNVRERSDTWRSVVRDDPSSRYNIILGARSAVLLPYSNLGLVVVDEEHDPSYKQADPAPRYNGRDAAIYLAHLHGAKVLLGSATPSVESYFNATQGKYGLVVLPERYAGMELPEIRLVNTREATRQGKMQSHFSKQLLEELEQVLKNGEQAILFQNRRGFSLRLECETCHWMPGCRNCDVTLVYHKKQNQLRCHYCGFVADIPEKCPECHGNSVKMKGFGTEKVEEELAILLPGARIARMDLDTTRTRYSLQHIISEFEERKIDILVGTQMVTKGLDFDHVSLVCILNADNMLSYPDFRSAERSFQLMAQVGGRSGRKNKRGKVIIQAYNPAHPVIRDVMHHDYEAMFRRQIAERLQYHYPPYVRMVMIRIRHKDPDLLNKAAADLAARLRKPFGRRILGPEYPMVSRIMNYYIKNILFKMERDGSSAAMKSILTGEIEKFQRIQGYSGIRVVIDVDPQ